MSIGIEYKIIVTGTMGAGKTTAISAISDVAPIRTEATNTARDDHAKATTTVALDYGEIALPNGDRIRLYGTPGQKRFSFMWGILAKGALGLILLIDSTSKTPLEDLAHFLDVFHELTAKAAVVIGITHRDAAQGPLMSDYQALLTARSLTLPMFSIDGREKEHVLLLVDALLSSIEAGTA